MARFKPLKSFVYLFKNLLIQKMRYSNDGFEFLFFKYFIAERAYLNITLSWAFTLKIKKSLRACWFYHLIFRNEKVLGNPS